MKATNAAAVTAKQLQQKQLQEKERDNIARLSHTLAHRKHTVTIERKTVSLQRKKRGGKCLTTAYDEYRDAQLLAELDRGKWQRHEKTAIADQCVKWLRYMLTAHTQVLRDDKGNIMPPYTDPHTKVAHRISRPWCYTVIRDFICGLPLHKQAVKGGEL